MGYGELDKKAINTIRVLAVSRPSPPSLYSPSRSSALDNYPATTAKNAPPFNAKAWLAGAVFW